MKSFFSNVLKTLATAPASPAPASTPVSPTPPSVAPQPSNDSDASQHPPAAVSADTTTDSTLTNDSNSASRNSTAQSASSVTSSGHNPTTITVDASAGILKSVSTPSSPVVEDYVLVTQPKHASHHSHSHSMPFPPTQAQLTGKHEHKPSLGTIAESGKKPLLTLPASSTSNQSSSVPPNPWLDSRLTAAFFSSLSSALAPLFDYSTSLTREIDHFATAFEPWTALERDIWSSGEAKAKIPETTAKVCEERKALSEQAATELYAMQTVNARLTAVELQVADVLRKSSEKSKRRQTIRDEVSASLITRRRTLTDTLNTRLVDAHVTHTQRMTERFVDGKKRAMSVIQARKEKAEAEARAAQAAAAALAALAKQAAGQQSMPPSTRTSPSVSFSHAPLPRPPSLITSFGSSASSAAAATAGALAPPVAVPASIESLLQRVQATYAHDDEIARLMSEAIQEAARDAVAAATPRALGMDAPRRRSTNPLLPHAAALISAATPPLSASNSFNNSAGPGVAAGGEKAKVVEEIGQLEARIELLNLQMMLAAKKQQLANYAPSPTGANAATGPAPSAGFASSPSAAAAAAALAAAATAAVAAGHAQTATALASSSSTSSLSSSAAAPAASATASKVDDRKLFVVNEKNEKSSSVSAHEDDQLP